MREADVPFAQGFGPVRRKELVGAVDLIGLAGLEVAERL